MEDLLGNDADPVANRNGQPTGRSKGKRDKTRVITYRVPHNGELGRLTLGLARRAGLPRLHANTSLPAACVQIYDYKAKKARVCFGPDLIKLDYEEQFTVLSLRCDGCTDWFAFGLSAVDKCCSHV